jgi:tetratricopeptide (TPR) repeat protein
MKPKRSCLIILVILFIALGLSCPAPASDVKCALAGKISEEASKAFKADKKEGLRLFLKAYEYCPEDPTITFNLGLAYYKYGNLREAEGYIAKSVQKNAQNSKALNLLAWLMLENQSDKAKALQYARQAEKLSLDSAAIADTVIRAFLENGELYEAATKARGAKAKWPKDQVIEQRYNSAIDAYVAYYLGKLKEGKTDDALEGLKKADFDPDVVNAYCWALYSAGKSKEALSEAELAKSKFRDASSVKDTFDQIMDKFVQDRYNQFRTGKREEAVMALDDLKKVYPTNKPLNEAYDKMFKAVLEEARTIDIPAPKPIAPPQKVAGGQGNRLLAELQGQEGGREREGDLLVDVDKDIPKGKDVRGTAIAVIIGNKEYSRYNNGIPDVDYAERDAGFMRQYVIHVLGYREENIIYEKNATLAELNRIFGTAGVRGELFNWVKPKKSEVFIYYTGHGAPDAGGKGAFLVPVDAHVDYIASSGYSLDTFYENLSKLPAKKIIVVLDACFSGDSAKGMLVKGVSPATLKSISPVREIANATTFASADRDQVSTWFPEKRHSLFTYFFLKGLKGDADANRDKKISVKEMKEYLDDNVPYQARRLVNREQTPIVEGDDSWVIATLR